MMSNYRRNYGERQNESSERMFPLVILKGSPTLLEWLNGILFVLASIFSYTLWLAQTFSVLERAISTRFLESYDARFQNVKSLIFYIVAFISVSLFRVNKKANRIESRLNVRYQVRDNLKVLRVFSAIAVFCMAWQLVATTLLVLILSLYKSHASDILGHVYLQRLVRSYSNHHSHLQFDYGKFASVEMPIKTYQES
ncbi:hypothetical protein PRIPAC_79608 [Pristionchus pacificus]|nr:hypothetical protein PRIPAC_79608 [Pristionchus pacificus]